MTIITNTRVLNTPLTGIQRYTQEILTRLPQINQIRPHPRITGPLGHAWEQTILPFHIGNNLLWSPSNTGPIAVRNQVVTVHDLATFDCPEGFSASFRAAYAFILPRLLPRVKGILTVSEFTKQCLIERFHLPADKIHVTPLGVDHTRFNPRPQAEVATLRQKLNLPPRYILFLGALSARKNMKNQLQAWQRVQSEVGEDIHLAIAGGAGMGRVFNGTTMPTLPPRTHLLGRIADADLPALYTGATAFVFPSLYEGFGLPPLEAMACGTPVITSNTTSLPEVVGDAAITINPHSVDKLAQALKKLLTDEKLRSSLKQKGLARGKQFVWEKTAEQTLTYLTGF